MQLTGLSVRARIALAQIIPLVPLTALVVGAALSLLGLASVLEDTRGDGLVRLNELAEAIDLFRQEAALVSRWRVSGDPADLEGARARAESVAAELAGALGEDWSRGGQAHPLGPLLVDYERLAGLHGEPGPPEDADRAARKVLAAMKVEHGRLASRLQAHLVAAESRGRSMAWGLVALGGLLVVSTVVATQWVSRSMVRDLAQLEEAASALSAGDFGHRLTVKGDDELARMAEAMNRLATRITALDRMKGDFFANISHDLKTPLTSILEACSLLEEEVAGPLTPDQRRLVIVLQESSRRLRALVQSVLDMNRLGTRNNELQAGDLIGAVSAVFSELRLRAERAGVGLVRGGLVNPPPALVNRGMIEQVLLNLVGNALSYAPRGSVVRVVVEQATPDLLTVPAPAALLVRVIDSGPGIPPADRDRVFERYVRLPGAVKGGSGLGLAICRAIVESHGGRISIDEAPGGGAAVCFSLAVAGPPPGALPPASV